MVSYYGSKSKIVKLYLPPTKDIIIEPFAGTARYSLMYWQKDVRLYDLNPNIITMWHYLQSATEKDLLSLPKLKIKDDLRNFDLSEGERCFLGFCVNMGSANPRNVLTKWESEKITNQILKISQSLFKIKHWDIKLGSYDSIENIDATWFIDAPYQFGGEHYPFSNKNLDFNQLAEWCKERKGQTIVCENTKSNWLPFEPMKKIQGQRNTFTTEAVWYNYKL